MGNHWGKIYTTTQPDEVRYITPATYNLNLMIFQITPVQGKHLYLSHSFNKESAITLTKLFSQKKRPLPWP